MHRERRRRKLIGAVAATAAVAALAVVLVLMLAGAPSNEASPGTTALVMVDGEKITVEDVAKMQLTKFYRDNVWRDTEEVLEELISEKLLLREATQHGYLPTMEATEVELIVMLADMGVSVEFFREMLEEDGFSYQEFLVHLQVQMAINDLLDDVIDVPEITEEEAREFYESSREYYRELHSGQEPPPFEEMQARAIAILQDDRRNEAINLLIAQLRAQADIVYVQPEL